MSPSNKVVPSLVLLLGGFLIAETSCPGQTPEGPLVRFDSTQSPAADPAFDIQVIELERNGNTSKVRVIHRKGGPTGSALLAAKGVYEIAKARHAKYFIALKEWTDPDGSWMSIEGFTDEENPDLKTAFGEPYEETNKYGQKRVGMSVAQAALVFDRTAAPPPPGSIPSGSTEVRPPLDRQLRILQQLVKAYKDQFNQNPPTGNHALYLALLGENPRKIRFLDSGVLPVNGDGEFIDGWQTPYRVTGDDGGAFEIRSAGKDKTFGTDDDLVVTGSSAPPW